MTFVQYSPSTKAIVTPTFSKDRELLSNQLKNSLAESFEEGRRIASQWDVTQCRSFLHRRKLDTNEDWISLFKSCDAIQREKNGIESIDLEKVLKTCYEIAFAMPPSPTSAYRPNMGSFELPSLSI